MLKVIVHVLWFVIFVAFASLQFNDPDPWIWVTAYLVFAVIALAGIWKRLPIMVFALPALVAIVWTWFQWPVQWEGIGDSMTNENTERARESLGLLICILSMIVLVFLRKSINTVKEKS
jgi:uncharacterized membrane protein YoaK (UPF0700 family)